MQFYYLFEYQNSQLYTQKWNKKLNLGYIYLLIVFKQN